VGSLLNRESYSAIDVARPPNFLVANQVARHSSRSRAAFSLSIPSSDYRTTNIFS
jgi:hypothetical protein